MLGLGCSHNLALAADWSNNNWILTARRKHRWTNQLLGSVHYGQGRSCEKKTKQTGTSQRLVQLRTRRFANTCLFLCFLFLNESLANVPRRDLRLGCERAFGSGYTDFAPDELASRALERNNTARQTPRHVSHNELYTDLVIIAAISRDFLTLCFHWQNKQNWSAGGYGVQTTTNKLK